MPKPHGGKLIDRTTKKQIDTKDLPTIEINTNLSEDILNIAHGVFSPLEGFQTRNDLENIITHKRLTNDTPWTIPILLDADEKQLNGIKEGDTVLLTNNETG